MKCLAIQSSPNLDGLTASLASAVLKGYTEAGGQAELHIYSKGGHGFGMNQRGLPVDSWIERFHDWLKATGF